MASPLLTQLANVWLCVCDCVCARVCVRLPESTLILPFVCVMIQLKEGGCTSKRGRIFPIPCYLKMTPIVLLFSAFFFVWRGSWGEGKSYFCQIRGTNAAGELWGGAVLAVLGHVWSATHWALIGRFQGPPGRLRPRGSSFWQNGTSFLEIRAFSTRQGRVPSKLTTQSFNT